nr:galactosyltransferase II [Gracilariopsis lemaneiformis]
MHAIASAPVSPALRIIVLTEASYSQHLPTLLQSLSKADYEKDTVALDVWMFASSLCDYFPLPLYPLAMTLFGPPRFDHSIPHVVHSVHWPHGENTLIAHRTEPNWAAVWESSRGTANETLLFIDASTAKAVSPSFYTWLKRTRQAVDRGMTANVGVISLDSVVIPDGVPAGDRAVILEQFFPATAAFSPTQDAWVTFLKWHAMHSKHMFSHPLLARELNLGGYDMLDALRVDAVRAWFAQFLALYHERVVHPVLPEKQALLLRRAGTTGARTSGTGVGYLVHIDAQSELDANFFEATLKDTAVPEQPVLVKANGAVTTADANFGVMEGGIAGRTRSAVIEDLLDKEAVTKYKSVLRRIAEFARSRGTSSISFTLATGAFLETTLSWLCNVAVLEIAPPAMVIVTSEEKVANALTEFMSKHPTLGQGTLIIAMDGAVKAITEADSPDKALRYGTAGYWMLMLQRTFLLRDLLDHGVSILHFETDQVWLSDPMPYIQHELKFESGSDSMIEDYRYPDMVVTRSAHEIAGNFFYLRPSVSTRQLISTLVDRFYLSHKTSVESLITRWRKRFSIANDQSLLTVLVLQTDWLHRRRFPKVKYKVLNPELFVDGRWFWDFEDVEGRRVEKRKYYTSESSLYPVILNNNYIEGVETKKSRAQRFGFWFVKERQGEEEDWTCDAEAVRQAGRSGSSKEEREAKVVELGRSNTLL